MFGMEEVEMRAANVALSHYSCSRGIWGWVPLFSLAGQNEKRVPQAMGANLRWQTKQTFLIFHNFFSPLRFKGVSDRGREPADSRPLGFSTNQHQRG